MKRGLSTLSTVILAGVVLICTGCTEQQPTHLLRDATLWQKYNDAGQQAAQNNDLVAEETQLKSALNLAEKFSPADPRYFTSLSNLAMLYKMQGKYKEALPLYEKMLVIDQKYRGPSSRDVAMDLSTLGKVYSELGDYAKSEPLFKQAVEIYNKDMQLERQDVASTLDNYAGMLRQTKRELQAAKLEARAQSMRNNQDH